MALTQALFVAGVAGDDLLTPFRLPAFSGERASRVTSFPRASACVTIERLVPPVAPRTSIFAGAVRVEWVGTLFMGCLLE